MTTFWTSQPWSTATRRIDRSDDRFARTVETSYPSAPIWLIHCWTSLGPILPRGRWPNANSSWVRAARSAVGLWRVGIPLPSPRCEAVAYGCSASRHEARAGSGHARGRGTAADPAGRCTGRRSARHIDSLAGPYRHSDAARPASGGGAGATGQDDRPSHQRSGAVQQPNRPWSVMTLGGAKPSHHFFRADSWQRFGWLNHNSGGRRRTSTNLETEKMTVEQQLCRPLAFARVR